MLSLVYLGVAETKHSESANQKNQLIRQTIHWLKCFEQVVRVLVKWKDHFFAISF